MFYSKKGFPEESEIVLCTVTKIHHGSVFVVLDEYGRKTGIINISEISPGRIRNIRDYVQEGKKSICKILRVDPQRGHIDISLRRVTESQRRAKNSIIKHEQKAEKMVELFAKEIKMQPKELYDKIMNNVKYESLYSCFEDVAMDNFSLDKTGLDKKIVDKLTVIIKHKITPPEVVVEGHLNIISHDADGVEVVKEALKKAQAKNVVLKYAGGGRYNIKATAEDYKTAENILKKSTSAVLDFIEEKGGEGNFERKEAK